MSVARLAVLCITISHLAQAASFKIANEGFLRNQENSRVHYAKRSVARFESILGEFETAAVACDHETCSKIGGDVLRRNGTAADAAIAALFCLGVLVPESMGIGGGFFGTYYQKSSGNAFALDARERAPGAAYQDMYDGDEVLSAYGGLSIAVPGEVKGYYELYTRFGGGVPWEELVQPSIDLCEEGYTIPFHFANSLQSKQSYIYSNPSLSIFINPDTGTVYEEGEFMTRPDLAVGLKAIQADPNAIYDGSLTETLLQELQSFGSIITKEDLSGYQAIWRDPIEVSLSNGQYKLYSVPPPASGGILAYILNILDNYRFTPESLNEESSTTTHQRIAEAFKYGYAKRTEQGDMDYVDLTQLISDLTSEEFAQETFEKITDDMTFQDPEHYGVDYSSVEDHGTSHLSVIAPNGDAIAVTTSVNLYFGSANMSTTTGIIWNDSMDDFSSPNITNSFGLPPFEGNFIEPGKRPLSSMCPTVVVDEEGNAALVVGAAGGSQITSATSWTAIHNLWLGKNIKEAIDSERLHHQLFPMTLQYQENFDQDIIQSLGDIGHETGPTSSFGSVVCGISRANGTLNANADYRKRGSVDGF